MMIDETRRIGPTTYCTQIWDDPGKRALEVNVKERTWGTVHSSQTIWPYEDKAALVRQLSNFISRVSEPIKGEWFGRFASWLLQAPLVGRLGAIAEIETRNRRIDAFLAECKGDKVFVMKDGPNGWKGNQMTFWIRIPFSHLNDIRERIAEQDRQVLSEPAPDGASSDKPSS